MNDYDYNYHDLAENSDFLEEDDIVFSDDEYDHDVEDTYQEYVREYKDYYHNIIDELDD